MQNTDSENKTLSREEMLQEIVTGGRSKQKKLWLNSLPNTRKSVAKVIREYYGLMDKDVTGYRCLGYLLNILITSFKIEKELEMEGRLSEIEQLIEEHRIGK